MNPRLHPNGSGREQRRATAQAVSARYFETYNRVAGDEPGMLPTGATTKEYAQRTVECYPFHSRLLDTAHGHPGALPAGAVHEQTVSTEGLKLMMDEEIIRNSMASLTVLLPRRVNCRGGPRHWCGEVNDRSK